MVNVRLRCGRRKQLRKKYHDKTQKKKPLMDSYRRLLKIKRLGTLEPEVMFCEHPVQLTCKPVFNNLNAKVGDGAVFKKLSPTIRTPSKEMEKAIVFSHYSTSGGMQYMVMEEC